MFTKLVGRADVYRKSKLVITKPKWSGLLQPVYMEAA